MSPKLILSIFLGLQIPFNSALGLEAYELKALFLLNFTRIIQWPGEMSTIQLCIIGDNPFGSALEELVAEFNKTAKIPRTISYYRDIDVLMQCQIVYVEESMYKQIDAILAKLSGQPILTVSSMEAFVHRGGMLQFYPRDDKLRFYINPKALNRSGLKIDVNLMRVGDIVETD